MGGPGLKCPKCCSPKLLRQLVCSKCQERDVKRRKAARDRRRAAGTCVDCDDDPLPGRPRCDRHARQRYESRRRYALSLKEPPLTSAERLALEHATGWRSAEPLYRNYYVLTPGCDGWDTLQGLCVRGLMRMTRELNDVHVFSVTPAGLKLLRKTSVPGPGKVAAE